MDIWKQVQYAYVEDEQLGSHFKRMDSLDLRGRYDISKAASRTRLPTIRVCAPALDVLLSRMDDLGVFSRDLAWMKANCEPEKGFWVAFRAGRRGSLKLNLDGGGVAPQRTRSKRFWVSSSVVAPDWLHLLPGEWVPATSDLDGLKSVMDFLCKVLPPTLHIPKQGPITTAAIQHTILFENLQLAKVLLQTLDPSFHRDDPAVRSVEFLTLYSNVLAERRAHEMPLVLVWRTLLKVAENARAFDASDFDAFPWAEQRHPDLGEWQRFVFTRSLYVVNGPDPEVSGTASGGGWPTGRFTSVARYSAG